MDPNKKQAIVDKLAYIVTHITDSSSYASSPPPKKFLGIERGAICLVGEAYEMYDSVCDMLASEKSWKEKLSTAYIDKGVHALLGRIIKDGNADNISVQLDTFIAECENASEEYIVYLPLDNIRMVFDRLRFGKITLINMRSDQIEEHVHRFTAAISDQEERGHLLNHWRRDALPLLHNRVVAMYTISAEPTRAHELAEAEWYRFADILLYFIFLFYKKQYYIDVGLRGDVRYGVGEAVLIPSTYHTFQTAYALKSPQALLVGPSVVDAMQNCGVFALADMLHSEQKNAFSDTLFTGIHWVANALIQSLPANEYLSLVSCLETFLTRERGDLGSISNAVATGVGWILGRDFADRLALHKEVKKIYEKRSTISHGGNQEDIASGLPRLREIVGAFILRMVQRRDEFRKSGKQGLFGWIDQGPLRPEPSPTRPQE